jgi:hypothetical protein
MYLIREIFTAKPGNASKLAKLMKKMPGPKGRIMTDMVGPYNTVVAEFEVKSLAEWEKEMEGYKSGKGMEGVDPELAKEMSNYTEMYLTGRREIFQIHE